MTTVLVAVPVHFIRRAVIHVEVELVGISGPEDLAVEALQDLVGFRGPTSGPSRDDLMRVINEQDDGDIEVQHGRAEPENQFVDFRVVGDPAGFRFK